MKTRFAYIRNLALAVSLVAGMLALLPAVSTGLLGQQETDPYKLLATQSPSLADTPLEFNVFNEHTMVDGVPQYVGWVPIFNGRILGRVRNGDAVIIELAQGGKEIHTMRCGLKDTQTDQWYEDWSFRGDDSKDLLKVFGKIDATFNYYTEKDGKTTLLTKRQFNIVRLADYEDRKSVWKYGVLNDDLLGFSYAVMRRPESSAPGFVWLYTWMNLESSYSLKDISYQIEVNGQRLDLPTGFDANENHEAITSLEQSERVFIKAKNDTVVNRYNTYLMCFRPYLAWGKKEPRSNTISLIDHPGQWVFRIRVAGQLAREFKFAVLPNGVIAPHPEQDPSRTGFLNLGPGRAFLETYFPNPNTLDDRFNPDAIRAGMLNGRPWISEEIKQKMLSVLPPRKPGAMPFPQPSLPPAK